MFFGEKIRTYTLDGDCTFDEFKSSLAKTVYFVQTVSPLNYFFFVLTQISKCDYKV